MLPSFQEVLIDDVPAVWAEAPGPLTVCLSFGVGRAHESLSTAGISHLVEHLALWTLGKRDFQYNGAVGATITSFYASGSPEELGAFISQTTKALGDLPLQRLETERQVLLTEEGSRGGNFLDDLSSIRFGARTFGLPGFTELGLRRVTADEVVAWATERFVAEAAALWITGPPPENLSLAELPRGRRRRPPEARSIESLNLPSFVGRERQGCSFSMLGRRSTALRMGASILAQRVQQILRHERGLIYNTALAYDPLTSDQVHVALNVDALPERSSEVAIALLDLLDEMCERGANQDELAGDVAVMRKGWAEPMAIPAMLEMKIINALLGTPPLSNEEVLSEASATTSEDVASVLQETRSSLLMQVPESVDVSARIPRLEPAPHPAVIGRRFKSKAVMPSKRREVVVGEEGVSLGLGEERVRILFDDCVALIESAEGRISLVSADADMIELNPAAFAKGFELRSAITQRISDERVIPIVPEARARRSVEEVAARDLMRRWAVENELAALPAFLAEGEDLLLLAEATRGSSAGLLAVTNRRMIFLTTGMRGRPRVDEITRETRTHIKVSRDRLSVGCTDGSELALTNIVPQEKAREAAKHLGLSIPEESSNSLRWPVVRPLAFALVSILYALFFKLRFGGLVFGGAAILDVWLSGRLSRGRVAPWAWLYFVSVVVAAAGIALSFVD